MKFEISDMKLRGLVLLLVVGFAASRTAGQVPPIAAIQILKAEDARRYDSTLEGLMKSPNADVRKRAALAAGRIGNDAAIPALGSLLASDPSGDVRAAAAFALGEIESIKAADAILLALKAETRAVASVPVTARAVEAAGKIAAANPKDPKTKDLGKAIVEVLKTEDERAKLQDTQTVLLALTAVLRARPEGADDIVARYLTNYDARVRTDAANTIARLKSKKAAEALRKMLTVDTEAAARANAARALGNMQDKDSLNELLSAATEDKDSRVRVSAVNALATLDDARAAKHLIERGNALLKEIGSEIPKPPGKALRNPRQLNELLVIATAVGRTLPNTEDSRAVIFINQLRMEVGFAAPETEIALARVAPKAYVDARLPDDFGYRDPWMASAYAQGLAEIAAAKDPALISRAGEKLTTWIAGMASDIKPRDQAKMLTAMPDLTRAQAALKPDNLVEILRGQLANTDVFIRTAAAELLAEQPKSKENIEALKAAFTKALLADKIYNDAQLSMLDALYKLDKKESVGTLLIALNAPDYLIRKKALELLADKDLQKDFPGIATSLENAKKAGKDKVLPYNAAFGTKLGQVLNTDVDYRRALSRKNGSVKALLTTEKGTFTIDLYPEEAPLTVDTFINLARARYFNGLEVHRVVPNFVMQDGDPRGDGNGGPGWSIRCEMNMHGYDRGAVGMALSGKDTGGSQWFVTHSPQPHLDGGYTVFGHVNETDMKVVDNIVRGDKILNMKIVETGNSPHRAQRTHRK